MPLMKYILCFQHITTHMRLQIHKKYICKCHPHKPSSSKYICKCHRYPNPVPPLVETSRNGWIKSVQKVFHWIIMMNFLHPVCLHILSSNLQDSK